VELRVLAAGLNFRDVLNALGMYPGGPVPLGTECVGEVVGVGGNVPHLRVGDLAVGVAFGSIATHVTTSATLFVRAPNALAVADAATIPIAFLTAYLALTEIARLRRGDRVLIHAAAGGVGLAAVQLAVRAGAEVIATAGSPAKREFLRRLGVRHVFDSRTTGFAEGVEAALGGRSIDVVLNSLTGDFIPKSLHLLAPGGRFLEIGKRGIWSAEDVESLRPDVEYRVVYLGEVCVEEPRRVERMLNELASCFGEGTLKPLPVAVYEAGRAVDAFRFMAQARHIGKIVVTFPERSTRGCLRNR
jgi:NADPH:quinone reductase-like Zn-dependent oxidoreductase